MGISARLLAWNEDTSLFPTTTDMGYLTQRICPVGVDVADENGIHRSVGSSDSLSLSRSLASSCKLCRCN